MHSSTPLVSILIPNYNKALYLRETLHSVWAQTYSNWECIVVDDHSTDDSWEVLDEYAAKDTRFQIYKRPDHLPKGGNVCRNYAFEFSQGEFIQWFDSDDLMNPDLLGNRLNAISSSENIDFIFSPIVRLFPNNRVVVNKSPESDYDSIVSSFLMTVPCWMIPSAFFRKEFLLKNKIKWDEKLFILQDVMFGLEVLYFSGNSYLFLNSNDWRWRIHDDGKNVGSKLSEKNNIVSLGLFLEKAKNMFDDKEKFHSALSSGYLEIIRNSQTNFGFIWWYFLVFRLRKLRFNHFFILFSTLFFILFYHFTAYFSTKLSLRVKGYCIYKLKENVRAGKWL